MQVIWRIENLESKQETGQVVIAHWRVNANEGNISASAYGSVAFEAKDPTDPEFIPFENLTEETVIEWVKDKLDVVGILQGLEAEIERHLNPPVVVGTPW